MKFLKKIIIFLTKDLWKVRLNKIRNPYLRMLIQEIRIFHLAIRGFNEDKCLTKATALTYYTLFSIVPVLALAFAIAKGFGFQKFLQKQILEKYSEYEAVLSKAFVFADAMLSSAKGGVIAGFGILLLLWSVINLLTNIENSFNEIWEIKKGRPLVRKITDYTTIIVLTPIFFILSGSLSVFIQSGMSKIIFISKFNFILIEILAWCIMCLIFSLVFKVLPNTRVEFKAAIKAGIVTLILFELVKWGYIRFQIGVNRINAIYGGFAALPLFLIWIQYSWFIVLFGAELSYAHQNAIHFEMEKEIENMSERIRKLLAILIMRHIVLHFVQKKTPPTPTILSHELDIPLRVSRMITNDLLDTKLILETTNPEGLNEPGLVPAYSDEKISVWDVWFAMENKGVNDLPLADIEEKNKIEKLLHTIELQVKNSSSSLLIRDLI